jgi:hypothetical protein
MVGTGTVTIIIIAIDDVACVRAASGVAFCVSRCAERPGHRLEVPIRVSAMPALIGYMLAIVVTLGGYFAGLHWLISPPDPWQAGARTQTSSAHATATRKRVPAARPAEIARTEPDASKESEVTLATVEAPPAAPVSTSETALPIAPAVLSLSPKQSVRTEDKPPARTEAARPEPRRETKPKPVHRKLADKSAGRKLQLMVLRTYQRADGTRFSRLLSLSEARSAMAFQPEW